MKTRPCVVVQNDIGNRNSQLTIIVPTTDAEGAKAPSPIYIPVPRGEGGLLKDSLVVCNQIRTVDESRLGEVLGKLSDSIMAKIDQALKISLALD